jgi:hypothetical protein
MRRLLIAGVVVALTANQSFAGCGLLSKIFGGRCSASRPAVQSCQQAAPQVVPVNYVPTVPVVSITSQSCPNGQCANQAIQVGPVRRSFSLFGR